MSKATASETLMSALEEVDDAESVLIIIRHKSDDKDHLSWHQFPASYVETLGMLEFARTVIRRDLIKEES